MITTIQHGDTPITLAVRHYQNPDRWTDIVHANDLTYPFIVPNRADFPDRKVLQHGDPLLVPEQPTTQPLTATDAESNAYGVDLAWNEFSFQVLPPGGRLTIDRGIQNLRKALYRRLITYPGELKADPTYGCRVRDHLGEPAAFWRAELSALDVLETLFQDPRVYDAYVFAEYLPSGELYIASLVFPIPPAESFALNLRAGGNRVTRV